MGCGQASGKGGGRGADSKRRGDFYQRKSTPDASVLGLGVGAVRIPSLGGGAMNLASLLGGGGGLQTQINPLAGVLGGTSGLLGTPGVSNELVGLCALLGNQQSHNVSLTNLQVVELQRDVAAQKLASEKQAAAVVQAKIDEKVAAELCSCPEQPSRTACGCTARKEQHIWGRRLVVISIWLISRRTEETNAYPASPRPPYLPRSV